MDPIACLAQFLEAVADRDIDEIRNAADALAHWLDIGGSAPVRIEEIATIVRDIATDDRIDRTYPLVITARLLPGFTIGGDPTP